jgi:hypothetical protein
MTAPAPAPIARRRGFPAWAYITSFFAIVVVALLPLLVTMVAIGIAGANGCQINESSVQPCIIGGTDYGADLQGFAFSFWFFLFSVPLALALFVVWLIVFVIHLVVANNRRKAASA